MRDATRRIVYRLCRILCRLIFLPCRFEISGLPAGLKGPLILAGNHISHFDPPAVGVGLSQVVHFMAMKDLFSRSGFRILLETIFAIPVDREGSGLEALHEATRRLRSGAVVGIFPEAGLRTGADSVLEGRPLPPGAALLCRRTRTPVLPFLVLGTDQLYAWRNWFYRPTVILRFLDPISPHGAGGLRTTEAINEALTSALRNAYQDWKLSADFRADIVPRSAMERWREAGKKGENPVE